MRQWERCREQPHIIWWQWYLGSGCMFKQQRPFWSKNLLWSSLRNQCAPIHRQQTGQIQHSKVSIRTNRRISVSAAGRSLWEGAAGRPVTTCVWGQCCSISSEQPGHSCTQVTRVTTVCPPLWSTPPGWALGHKCKVCSLEAHHLVKKTVKIHVMFHIRHHQWYQALTELLLKSWEDTSPLWYSSSNWSWNKSRR